jgi:hypothetical protein
MDIFTIITKCLPNYRFILVYFVALFFMGTLVIVSELNSSKESLLKSLDLSQQSRIRRSVVNDQRGESSSPSSSPINEKLVIYSPSDSGVILTSLSRNQKLIVDKRLNTNKRNVNIKIDPPSPRSIRYNLKNKPSKTPTFYSQINQDKLILHLLNTDELKRENATENGIFIEAGAYDGETWSNTLHLEQYHNWTGLLIEPSTETYSKLKSKNRKSYSTNSCLCPGTVSTQAEYIDAGPFGITINLKDKSLVSTSSSSIYKMTCYPLDMILEAFFTKSNVKNKFKIDYMSIDIEGKEKEIVQTFPWHRYNVNLLNIEYNQDEKLYEWIKMFLEPFGYHETIVDNVWHQDVYLAHDNIFKKLNKTIKNVSQFLELKLK